ncbi:YwpF-like family protein [Bacillus sp. FJAT-49736]|uniref:YwpF-like family protein n=1 Tax=Bacillus sp. FJAT-49736 TaxID=2833582 RepID=UPI001BC8CC06|nr:YwpF-like family protein [Bacillus sp. FJAT-49736]MBS4175446.1 YwpF-like family protein [Bacillus sp. FJAT-49736]
MKTFKIVSLQVIVNGNIKDIPLEDGLIINKEDGKKNWLIEAYISKEYYDFFRAAQESPDELDVQVVITNEANDPAPLKTHIRGIKQFKNYISVLLEGYIRIQRSNYAELLLSDIVQEGFTGEELIQEFKSRMKKITKYVSSKKYQE